MRTILNETVTRGDKMRDVFLVLGSQYYAHARYSAQFFYLPVSVTLLHHSIEMLLKGYLAKNMPSAKLKNVGHNLVGLWDLFREHVSGAHLSKFDNTIRKLDRVELLRYPDEMVDKGYALHISLGTPENPIHFPETRNLPQYSVSISALDDLVVEIFAACEVSPIPYFKMAPPEFKNSLPKELR
jgi:hypothetical protein